MSPQHNAGRPSVDMAGTRSPGRRAPDMTFGGVAHEGPCRHAPRG